MRSKKSEQANLERHRGTYRQMGIILALGLLFIAFEYTNADIADPNYDQSTEVAVEMDYVPITKPKQADLPKPPSIIFDKMVIDLFNLSLEEDIEIISEIDPSDDIIFDHGESIEVDDDSVFIIVENAPEFPGGYTELMRYLSENVVYPTIAQEVGIQGRVYVQFVVNKKGKIVDVHILKGVDRSLNAEAMRVVQNMPDWKPGSQRGKTVNVSYRLPINFKLR
jgi:protein TonB